MFPSIHFLSLSSGTSQHCRMRKVQAFRGLAKFIESQQLKKRLKTEPQRSRRKYHARPIFEDHEIYGAWFSLIPTLRATDPGTFYNFFRMTVGTFDRLLEIITPCMRQRKSWRSSLCPGERLAITLRSVALHLFFCLIFCL